MRRTAVFLCLLTCLLAAAGSPCAETRPIVVELFTSQGCSSCPPADALLRELAGRADVIALGFHISYWDRLGWKDPLSNEASTDRQKAYASRLSGRVYTPQLVVEGTNEMIGSDRASVAAALRNARPDAVAPVSFSANRASVAIGGGAGAGEVVLVRFARSRVTNVPAGENAGRTLQDANGVTAVKRLGDWDGAARRSGSTRRGWRKAWPCSSRPPTERCWAPPRSSARTHRAGKHSDGYSCNSLLSREISRRGVPDRQSRRKGSRSRERY